jgi:hypothetical protein
MKVRAKFRCTRVGTVHCGGEQFQEEVSLSPVSSGSEENKEWSKYTPSGSITMNITAEGAVGVFKPGKEYFVEFTPAE